ncbi:hypothetical protein ACFYV7_23685 [Nocardia suismassiliense]|uniref:Uncharacterized protein n=1 Tax=Nocardia suismassiliense TaxID=2077092 RepID=A0ABW6QXF0_9NOCA
MTAVQFRRLAEVFSDLADEIAELLEPEDADLARTVPDLRFHGRCACKPTCTVLLTAASGSPTPYVLTLERGGEPVMMLDLDPSGSTVTGIEIMDGRELVLPPV